MSRRGPIRHAAPRPAVSEHRIRDRRRRPRRARPTPHGRGDRHQLAGPGRLYRLSTLEVVIVAVIAFAGATLQGSIGFGMGLFAAPILILIDPRFVPAPILISTLVLTTLLAYRERHAIDVRGIGWAMLGRLGGTAAAGGILAVVAADRLVLLFGLFILAGVAMNVSGLRFAPARPTLVAAGALSGLFGTVAAVGGPPMALLYQDAPGARMRSTISGFFLVGTIVSIFAVWTVGRLGLYEIRLALVMLPSMLAGFLLSGRTARYVDRGYMRPAVLGVSGLTGVFVVVRQLF